MAQNDARYRPGRKTRGGETREGGWSENELDAHTFNWESLYNDPHVQDLLEHDVPQSSTLNTAKCHSKRLTLALHH